MLSEAGPFHHINQRQQRAVAPRQSTSNITLASVNHAEHNSNNAITDSYPD
jgi:hypothetical protein